MSTKRYDTHGQRVSDCCGVYSTYMDKSRDPEADQVLCCKACYSEVGVGQGDGCEFRPGVDPDDYYQAVFAAEEQRFMYPTPGRPGVDGGRGVVTWTDARPRSPEDMARRPTRYEVVGRLFVGEWGGWKSIRVAFTARTTREGLLSVLLARGPEIVERTGVDGDEDVVPYRDDAGRWWVRLGAWEFGFTGRTERMVRSAVNEED